MIGAVSKKTELNSQFYSPFRKGADCCQVMSLMLDNQKLMMLLSNTSLHTVYDLQVHITDYQSRSDLIDARPAMQNSFGFLKVFNPCDISTTIQSFDKNTTVILASFPELYAHRHTLKVHTILTHGSFIQYQEFSHIGNHQWIFAEKVVNAITEKVLYNKFPKKFTDRVGRKKDSLPVR